MKTWEEIYKEMDYDAKREVDYLVKVLLEQKIPKLGEHSAFDLIGKLYMSGVIEPWLNGYKAGYRLFHGRYIKLEEP